MGYAWWKITDALMTCESVVAASDKKENEDAGFSRIMDPAGGANATTSKANKEDTNAGGVGGGQFKTHVKYAVTCEEVCLCLKGFLPDLTDIAAFNADEYGDALCEVLEKLSDLSITNNARIETVTGYGVFLTFNSRQRMVEAMRVAMQAVAMQPTKDEQVFHITAGLAKGEVVKGKIGTSRQSWTLFTGGVAHIADHLASIARNFGCTVLLAGDIENDIIFDYAFVQVDLLRFENCAGGRYAIYTVTEGAGVDADLSLLWVNVSRGDLEAVQQLLSQQPDSPDTPVFMQKMKTRLRDMFSQISAANMDTYDVSCRVTTILTVQGGGAKRAQRLGRTGTGATVQESAFLVLRLAGTPETGRKVREGMACFCMSVERFSGTVELLLSDRFIGRWTITNNDYTDVVMCSAQMLKVFDGWLCGLGLTTGLGETVEHRNLTLVCNDARARAECLAMLCFKYSLYCVADIGVVLNPDDGDGLSPRQQKKDRKRKRKGELDIDWRIMSQEGTFFIPKKIPSNGLVELHRPQNVIYVRAMQQMATKLWKNAREYLQQYMEMEEDDRWARELLNVVTTAAQQESVGTRGSDDPIYFVLDPSGGQFYLTDAHLKQATDANQAGAYNGGNDQNNFQDGALGGPRRSFKPNDSVSSRLDDDDSRAQLRDRKMVRGYLGFHTGFDASKAKGVVQDKGRLNFFDVFACVQLGCIIADCIVTPCRAMSRDNEAYTAGVVISLVFGYLCDVVTGVGIAVGFREPVTSERGILMTDPEKIREMYIKGTFPLDLLSCLPWELLWVPVEPAVLARRPWVRANRILKVFRYTDIFYKVQQRHFPDLHPIAQKLLVHLSLLLYFLYTYGCLFDVVMWDDYVVLASIPFRSNPTPADEYIIVNSQEDYFGVGDPTYPESRSLLERVLVTFHFAIRGFAGYGQKWPTTNRMILLCIVLVVVGIAIFATVIASLQTSAKMTHNEVFLERLDSVVATAEHRRLDSATLADILRYHRMLWAKTKQVYEGQFDEIRDELPVELVGELSYFANIKALDRIEVLAQAKNPRFVARMTSSMTMRFGAPGEQLLTRGDAFKEESTGIYFIYKGTAVAVVEGEDIETIEEGGYWGEISCLLGLPQAADFYIRSFCELYYLPMAGFRTVLKEFPTYSDIFVQSSARRREMIRSILAAKQADVADADGDLRDETESGEAEIDKMFDKETAQQIRSSFSVTEATRRLSRNAADRRGSALAASLKKDDEAKAEEGGETSPKTRRQRLNSVFAASPTDAAVPKQMVSFAMNLTAPKGEGRERTGSSAGDVGGLNPSNAVPELVIGGTGSNAEAPQDRPESHNGSGDSRERDNPLSALLAGSPRWGSQSEGHSSVGGDVM